MWVLGGAVPGVGETNDVWYSPDGTNWAEATSAAQWTDRYGYQALVFDNKMWVLGGITVGEIDTNDVWYSPDGTNWQEATPSAPWTNRDYHQALVFGNKMWVLGGVVTGVGETNDVWFSVVGPTVTSPTSDDVSSQTAVLGANVADTGGASVTERGVFWSVSQGFTPPSQSTKVSETGTWTTGTFSFPVTGLPPGDMVYFRAFAVNLLGTGYTDESEFRTLANKLPDMLLLFESNSASSTRSGL